MRSKKIRAQVLVEYLLLMIIAVGIATILTKQLVSRNETKPGIIINAWNKILINIGSDVSDCIDEKNCGN